MSKKYAKQGSSHRLPSGAVVRVLRIYQELGADVIECIYLQLTGVGRVGFTPAWFKKNAVGVAV